MVRQRYVGLVDPKASFETLRPMEKALTEMMTKVKPFGPEYLILDAVHKALTTAAYHFTREPNFYGRKPHG
jgi:hypothetical protein